MINISLNYSTLKRDFFKSSNVYITNQILIRELSHSYDILILLIIENLNITKLYIFYNI